MKAPSSESSSALRAPGRSSGAPATGEFTENAIAGGKLYRNAERIITEFQVSQPGQELIGGMLWVREANPTQWLLAESGDELGWTWLWQIEPNEDGHTRFWVRMRIEPPPGTENAVMTWFLTR